MLESLPQKLQERRHLLRGEKPYWIDRAGARAQHPKMGFKGRWLQRPQNIVLTLEHAAETDIVSQSEGESDSPFAHVAVDDEYWPFPLCQSLRQVQRGDRLSVALLGAGN